MSAELTHGGQKNLASSCRGAPCFAPSFLAHIEALEERYQMAVEVLRDIERGSTGAPIRIRGIAYDALVNLGEIKEEK